MMTKTKVYINQFQNCLSLNNDKSVMDSIIKADMGHINVMYKMFLLEGWKITPQVNVNKF